jgi:hypothetical protein
MIEVTACKERRKVKTLQVFKQNTSCIAAGERAGVCVSQLPPAGIERTFVAAPGTLPTFAACVCLVERCRFYSGELCAGARPAVFAA